ncbi:hypothetical protein MASR2M66_21070 [Chloroflexota bacterium]
MNFQPPSKSLTPRDRLFIALVGLLIIIASVGLYSVNRSLPNGGGEFLRHWVGARSFAFERSDPYSAHVPDTVQKLVYGRMAVSGEEPYILDTPFHLLLLYFPFSLLADPQTARAIYTVILEWALFALVYLSLRLTEWTAPRWFSILFFLAASLNFYTYQSILEASPILLLGLLYAGILLALRNEQDELTGALLALSLYFWEAGLPLLVLVIWYCYKRGYTRVFAGFGMLSFILLVISFLLYPGWLIPYLRAGMNNLRADYGFTIISAFTKLFPAYGIYLGWGILILLIFALGYEWNTVQRADQRRFYWVACLSIAAAPLLGFRTEMDNLSVLIIPLAFFFSVVYDRWRSIANFLIFILLMLIFLVPWTLYLFIPPQFELISQNALFLFFPLFTVLGLYWIRWWAIRPPRVWADAVTRNL